MDLRKLQRVIVDALEDVKAQDIQVFNTQGITDLFDRVVLATGTSNRQTRALASHVADEVKKAGGHVVSIEGEETGEWLLVDVGDAVIHVMQPAIRSYYNLEELWGAKPVKVKLGGGAPGPFAQASEDASADEVPNAPARRSRRVAMAEAADAEAVATLRRKEAKAAMKAEAAANAAAAADDAPSGRRTAGRKPAAAGKPAAKRPAAKAPGAKAPAAKATGSRSASGPRTAVAQSAAAKAPAKAPARKAPASTLKSLRSADDGDVPVRRSRLRSGQ